MNASLAALTRGELESSGVALGAQNDANGDLRVPAVSSEVGDIILSFQGDEITVSVGDITHCHFTPYDPYGDFPGCTPEQAAADAAQFVREIISDEWVLWRSRDGRVGGCYKPDGDTEESADAPVQRDDAVCFVWSGRLGAA